MNPKQFHRRLIGVVLVLAILMTFLCSNLYSIQYVNGEDYANQSVARSYETQTVPASRGPILDRNGKVLVSNQISYQVTLSLSLMGETAEERCANLLTLIQVCREEGVTWADTLDVLLRVAVPEVLLSLCWTPLVYLIFRFIFRRVGGTRLA